MAMGNLESLSIRYVGVGSHSARRCCQVGGSLKGRAVVDLMAVGAEFLALTSDGIVHEWNSYAPYLQHPSLVVPSSATRPNIPEPIEWTPDFQKKVRNKE